MVSAPASVAAGSRGGHSGPAGESGSRVRLCVRVMAFELTGCGTFHIWSVTAAPIGLFVPVIAVCGIIDVLRLIAGISAVRRCTTPGSQAPDYPRYVTGRRRADGGWSGRRGPVPGPLRRGGATFTRMLPDGKRNKRDKPLASLAEMNRSSCAPRFQRPRLAALTWAINPVRRDSGNPASVV